MGKSWSICKRCGELKEKGKQCQECQAIEERDKKRAETLKPTNWDKIKKEAEEWAETQEGREWCEKFTNYKRKHWKN